VDLPRRAGRRFRLALSIDEGESSDLAALVANGWQLIDPRVVAATPDSYREFVRSSHGELGIAKHGYVASKCGWFSDRSVCYLASGRPVIAEDTGFGSAVPTGEGLFAYRDAGDIEAALAALDDDYPRHRRAARELAEACFDSDRVLPRLLDRVGAHA
jgi:glycosyltransferase involved in cell wall biosynthesis